jgi:hypothetical protein
MREGIAPDADEPSPTQSYDSNSNEQPGNSDRSTR